MRTPIECLQEADRLLVEASKNAPSEASVNCAKIAEANILMAYVTVELT